MLSRLSTHQAGLLAVSLAAILWSTGGLFIKLISLGALPILCYRATFAALLFWVVFRKKALVFTPRIAVVVAFYVGLVMSFVVSTKLTTAANAIFLQYTAPIYIILLEPILFKLKLARVNIVTVVVSFVGMILFFLGDFEVGSMQGNLLGLASGVFLAGLMLSQRKNPPENHEAAIFWGNAVVALIALPFAIQAPLPTIPEWGMLSFLGIIQIGTGYMLFTYGLKRTLAIESALIAMLEPILNPVWVFLGYGERPSGWALLGGGIIVAMLVLRILITERPMLSGALRRRVSH